MLPFVGLWNEWGLHILVLLSFTLQVLLLLFGGIRRHNASSALRIFIWLVYLLADSTTTYTLGHMASTSLQHLEAFWAPLLVLHLGGQDTITAYALEDNELWLRHMLSLVLQALGAAYLLYKYIAGAKLLIPASILVFSAGILRYGERIWALKCASISSMQGSLVRLDECRLSMFSAQLFYILRASTNCDSYVKYKKIVTAATCALEFGKHLFVIPSMASEWRCHRDYLNGGIHKYYSHSGRSDGKPWIQLKGISEVIDLELSMIYDLLYTKAAVIHTWYGYTIRAFCFFATVSALMLFISSSRHSDYNRADVAVTYVLLVGASVLEFISIFRVIGSIWTYAYLSDHDWDRFAATVLSLRWHMHVRLGRWFASFRRHSVDSSKRWTTVSLGQYNLISMLTARLSMDIRWKIAQLIGLDDRWDKLHCSRFIPASSGVLEIIYTEINRRAELTQMEAKKFDDEIRLGRWTRHYDELETLNEGVFKKGLIGFIVVCHIATDIFYHCCDENEKLETAGNLPEVAMALSNYMMYLLRVHSNILPATEGTDCWSRKMYNEICNKIFPMLFHMVGKFSDAKNKQERRHTPHDILLNMEKHLTNMDVDYLFKRIYTGVYSDSVLASGSTLAAKLLEMEAVSLRQRFKLLAELWVDTLLFVADGITAKFHAKQLSHGGEFVTFVSVLMAHAGLQKHFSGPIPMSPHGDDAALTGEGTSDDSHEISEESNSTCVDVDRV